MSEVSPQDPRLLAGLDLLGRTGAKNVSLGYQDDVKPLVWVAVATWPKGAEAAGALDPLTALMRLLELAMDGGTCAHCGRVSGVSDDWQNEMPLNEVVCWYIYDPENQTFRRSCEGETEGRKMTMTAEGNVVGRNDPCPCGSGRKFKKCHGA